MARKSGLTTSMGHSSSSVGGPYLHKHIQNAGRPFGRAKLSRSFGSKGRGVHTHGPRGLKVRKQQSRA